MARVTIHHVPREHVLRIWPLLYDGVRRALKGSLRNPRDVLEDLQDVNGEELLVVMKDGEEFAGFVTYRYFVFPPGEKWGTVGITALSADRPVPVHWGLRVLESYFQQHGCTRINYVIGRRGSARLGRKLGFHPRLVEWTKEL